MTDAELIAKWLAFIETRLAELRSLARPAEIERDLRELRFAEHTLQIAIQAALDACSRTSSAVATRAGICGCRGLRCW